MNNLNNNINIQDGKFNHLSLAYKLNRFIVSYLKLFDDSLFTYNYWRSFARVIDMHAFIVGDLDASHVRLMYFK